MNAGSFQFQKMHEVSGATRLSLFLVLRLELALRPFLVFVSFVLLVRLYCVFKFHISTGTWRNWSISREEQND